MKQDRKPPRYMYQIRNIEYYAREGRLQPQTISSGQYEVFPRAGNPKISSEFWTMVSLYKVQMNCHIGCRLRSVVIIIISDLLQISSFGCTDLLLQQLSWIPVEESWVIWLANIKISHCFPYVFNHSSIHSFIHWMNELMAIFDPKIQSFIYWWLIKLSFIPP